MTAEWASWTQKSRLRQQRGEGLRPFLVGRMALRWRLGGPVMPERFTSGLYGPELVKVMGEAFELALANLDLPTLDAKKLLADAIIEGVDAGERDPSILAEK